MLWSCPFHATQLQRYEHRTSQAGTVVDLARGDSPLEPQTDQHPLLWFTNCPLHHRPSHKSLPYNVCIHTDTTFMCYIIPPSYYPGLNTPLSYSMHTHTHTHARTHARTHTHTHTSTSRQPLQSYPVRSTQLNRRGVSTWQIKQVQCLTLQGDSPLEPQTGQHPLLWFTNCPLHHRPSHKSLP